MSTPQIAAPEEECQVIVQPPASRPADNSIWVVSIEACQDCCCQTNHISRELRTGAFHSYCDNCRRRRSGKEQQRAAV